MSGQWDNDETYTLAYQVKHPDIIAHFGQICAEQALDELSQRGVNPRRKTSETILGRAGREADSDIQYFQEHEPGIATAEHCAFYRETYTAAFLERFRTESVIAALEEKYKRRSFIIVCYR